MHFADAHGRNWDANTPNGLSLNGDWSKWATAGQSAWLFRTGAARRCQHHGHCSGVFGELTRDTAAG